MGINKRVLDLIVVLLIVAGLVCLFYFPQAYYERVYQRVTQDALKAEQFLRQGDYEQGIAVLTGLRDYYDRVKQPLTLYLNHISIHELETSIRGCLSLAIAEDGQIFFELESIRVQAQVMREVERFSWHNLI